MLEQLNNSIRFLAFFTATKQGATGLTVTVDVYNPAGVEIVTAGSVTEIGDGAYSYDLASGSVTTEGEYLAIFKTADASVDLQHIPSSVTVGRAGIERLDASISSRLADADYVLPDAAADIADAVWDEATAGHTDVGSTGEALSNAGAAGDPLTNLVPSDYAPGTAGEALGRIGTGRTVVTAPVTSSSSVELTRGDDYSVSDSRALEWTSSSDGQWPDLTGADIVFRVQPGGLEITGEVVTATGAEKKVRVEPTAAETSNLTERDYRYDVKATLASGRVATLVRGPLTVEDIER